MTLADELKQRIDLKKAIIVLTEEELAELELRLLEEEAYESNP